MTGRGGKSRELQRVGGVAGAILGAVACNCYVARTSGRSCGGVFAF